MTYLRLTQTINGKRVYNPRIGVRYIVTQKVQNKRHGIVWAKVLDVVSAEEALQKYRNLFPECTFYVRKEHYHVF